MSKVKGIVLYDLELDGNINEVYTNNHPQSNGNILTETARIVESDGGFRGNGRMVYECFYFDHLSGPTNCTLTFNVVDGVIHADWILNGENTPSFTGMGFQMNERQIAIFYESV